MSEFSIFHWLIVLAIALLSFFGKRIFPPPDRGPRSGPPRTQFLPLAPIETSRSPKNPEEPPKPGLRASKH